MMLRHHGAEAVSRERVGALHEAEPLPRDNVVQVPFARTDRAVAVDDAREVCSHLEPHAAAVAPAGVNAHGWMLDDGFLARQRGARRIA